MKKLLYILLFVPLALFGQTVEDFTFVPPTSDNTGGAVFPYGTLNDFVGGQIMAFGDNSYPVSPSGTTIEEGGTAGVGIVGSYGNYDLASSGEVLSFAILMNGESIVNIDVNPPIIYYPQFFSVIDDYEYELTFTIDGNTVVYGCTDDGYAEYDYLANLDNGSCQEIRVDGCTDSISCVYNPDANFDDGSCIYVTEESIFNSCCLDNLVTSICPFEGCAVIDIDCDRPGCMSEWADNFDIFATLHDGSCYKMGCTSEWADNYDAISTTDDGSCDRLGCVSGWADNYDALATTDDGSCYRVGCVSDWADNYDEYATIDNELCYRYGCTSNLAVNYDEYATIDNDNCDFDIITHLNMSFDAWNISIDLSSGWNMFGYGCPSSMDLVEGLSNHTDKITIVKDNNGNIYMPEFGFNGIGDFTPGFGYQIKLTEAIEGFSLCDWYVNDIPEDNIVSLQEENANLAEENTSLQEEIDCYENPQVGDYCFGGIVFYVDETGKNGLISLSQDEGLMSWSEGLSHSENLILHGYDDWFLPSIYQLEVLYQNIGPPSNFELNFAGNNHWSSSLEDSNALAFNFVSGNIEIIDDNNNNNTSRNILPIREFGELQYGCIGCLFSLSVGDIAKGGVVFYVDETGRHGLVSSIEDIEGELGNLYQGQLMNNGYRFGCYDAISNNSNIFGETNSAVGTGYQNTISIIENCQETNIAALAATNFEHQGYDDWYLPSLDELSLISDIYSPLLFDFYSESFWTSTIGWSDYYPGMHPWFIHVKIGNNHHHPHNEIRGVIPIRSF